MDSNIKMTPVQQKKAIAFLKGIVKNNDKQASSDTNNFDDFPDNMEIRLFLIEVGAIPDRRKKCSK